MTGKPRYDSKCQVCVECTPVGARSVEDLGKHHLSVTAMTLRHGFHASCTGRRVIVL